MVKQPYSDTGQEQLRSIEWVGSSKETLKAFPGEVRDHMGFALYQAQAGFKHRDAKPFKGLGTGVLEVVSRHDGDTFRAVYTIRFKVAIYVLHAFQKKSKKGSAAPKPEIDLIKRRLKAAGQHYEARHGKK